MTGSADIVSPDGIAAENAPAKGPRPKFFYSREGDSFVPTGLGTSPWNPNAQLGVALAGLIGQSFDEVPTLAPMITARVTIDILGAVPMEPLTPVIRIVREGKRIQSLECDLVSGDRVWARGTALRTRHGSSPEPTPPLTRPLPLPDAKFHSDGWHDTIRVSGDYFVAGPGATWVRLTSPIIEGVPLSSTARMAMIADYAAGTGPLLSLREWTFANLDVAIYMARPPVGEWLLVEASSQGAGTGIGMSQGRIGDEGGMFATSMQTVFLDQRRG